MVDYASDFENAYRFYIRRNGAGELLEWLKSTDFFTAPASTKYHGAYQGGLVEHSYHVFERLAEITRRDIEGKGMVCDNERMETVAILGLLHDVCKADVYHTEQRSRKNTETGAWESYTAYTFRDPFPIGHGEKSIYLIGRYMALSEEEALAIRWHMGAYDQAARGGSSALSAAMSLTPWCWRLQEADMCATYIDEGGTGT